MTAVGIARPTPATAAVKPPSGGPYRLLSGWARTGRATTFAEHQTWYGPLSEYVGRNGRERLLAAVQRSGLRGRGGAGYPTGHKLRAVAAAGGRPLVIANGCEGEPPSNKDHALLYLSCHLVLDGIELAAYLVGAQDAVLCLHRDDPVGATVAAALAQRPRSGVTIKLTPVPHRYVSSEGSALVNFLNTGDARPTSKPPRPSERGVHGEPTLINNVETLAHLALIARYGPDWFRSCGTGDSPGSTLVTVSGAIAHPGVYEIALGTPIRQVIDTAGGPRQPPQAVLVGGYGGSWLPLPNAARLPLAHRDLAAVGAGLGAAALTVLPTTACGLAETARILRYLAVESAAQCGPCMFGLPAISDDFTQLAAGVRAGGGTLRRLQHRLRIIAGRGACAHPDGAVRLAASALRAFPDDLRAHLAGRPCLRPSFPGLPQPPQSYYPGTWR